MESLQNSQESVAVTVTMKITGSGATREEGRYQCLSSQPPALASQESMHSSLITFLRESLLQVLKNDSSTPVLFPHLPNKSGSSGREPWSQRNSRTLQEGRAKLGIFQYPTTFYLQYDQYPIANGVHLLGFKFFYIPTI